MIGSRWTDFELSRPRYGFGLATALGLSLAGCLDDGETRDSTGDANGDGTETDDEANATDTDDAEDEIETDVEDLLEEEEPQLSLVFETEDRKPVPAGL